ncbi:Alpha/Beta hydrolase protein [Aspergillus granulosus]|uniref:Alpha/Beta hydrolase protein n=1 Tax=Aspergillus granulosus TaxID=176169 RepID=A0ABR4HJ29_9EURO
MLFVFVVAAFAINALGLGLSPDVVPGNDPQARLTQDSRESLHYEYRRMVNEKSSLTLLYQNNLNASDDENHVGAILLDPMGQHDIRDACEEIGESMISFSTLLEFRDDFSKLFSYVFYSQGLTGEAARAHFYIRNGVLTVTKNGAHFDHSSFPSRDIRLSVLCTQTSSGASTVGRDTVQKLVRVKSTGNTYIGFRDQKSFRFLGVPYADPPDRFSYPKPYSGKSRTVYATNYGPKCAQAAGGSENCLHLNIQTPYIPKVNSTSNLRPVLFWIHGGDFAAGTGSDPVTDGGNLASREDIVVVTFNYRLSTLGFLAVPGTDLRGNYGLADQALALEWTVKNIAQFGGDPKQITIMGHSAGATSVKAFLGSPVTVGKFQGAVAMSDLGGRSSGSSKSTYGAYLTISDAYHGTGQKIFSEAGCNEGPIEQQVSCLKELPASTLVNLPTVARHIVQDGVYINTATLNLLERTPGTPNVPVIFGNTANEGASFATYPSETITSELEGVVESLHIAPAKAQRILDSGLFPSPNTGNLTFDAFTIAQRIATDFLTRCPTQAALVAGISSTRVFKKAYYYQTQRTISDSRDPDTLGAPARTPDFPLGDPDLAYFRLHGDDIAFIFGNLEYIRDGLDLHAAQLISAYFAQFVRSGNPNPHKDFLAARGYAFLLDSVNTFDRWEPIKGVNGPMQLLDFPSEQVKFRDLEQCEFLGWPVTHYLDLAGEDAGGDSAE